MEMTVPSESKPTYRKIGPYPARTLVALSVLSVIVAAILWFRFTARQMSPKPTPTTQALLDRPKISPPNLPQDVISPLKIEGLNISLAPGLTLPPSAFLVTAASETTFEDSAQKIAGKLGLKLAVATPEKITWSNPNSTLIAYKTDRHLSYFQNLLPDKSKSAPNLTTATDTIQKFFTKIDSWNPSYTLSSQSVKSLVASGYNLVPTANEPPDVIEIPFHLLYNQTPIIIGSQEYPLVVRLGHDQQIIGFTLYHFSESLSAVTDYSLLSPDQIRTQLSQNSERLISVGPLGLSPSPASNTLSQASLTSAETAYYYSATQKLLYPVYLLKGNGSFSDGSQASLTFLLSSINPSYFQ